MKQFRDLTAQTRVGTSNKWVPSEMTEAAIEDLRDTIVRHYSRPMNHIIRAVNGARQVKIKKNLRHILKKKLKFKYELVEVNSESDIRNQHLLEVPPKKHRFILIKGMCRCAITLRKVSGRSV